MARRVAGIKIDIAANVASLSADMTKAASILGGFEKQVNGLSRNLKMAFSGAIFAGAAFGVKQLSDRVLELAQAGDGAAGIASAFERLGGDSKALDAASERTKGLIEKFDLMKAANDGLIKGIPNLNRYLADLADLAARIADSKDLNTTEVFQQLIDAVSSGKAKSLKQFGFDIGEVKGQAEGTQAALSQLGEVISRLDPVSLGAGDSVLVFKNAMSEMGKNIAIGVDGSSQLAAALQGLRVAANPDDMQRFGAAIAGLEAVFIGLAAKALPTAISLLERFAQGVDHLAGITDQGEFTKRSGELTERENQLVNDLGNLNNPFSGGTFSNLWDPNTLGVTQAQNKARWEAELEQVRAERKKLIEEYNAKTAADDEQAAARQKQIAEEYAKRQEELFKKYNIGGLGGVPRSGKPSGTSNQGEGLKRESVDAASEYQRRMLEAQQRIGEEMQRQHATAVQQWQGVFQNLFDPGEFDWKSQLKQLATGFLSELMASLTGGLNANLGTFTGVGEAIAKGIVQFFQSNQTGNAGWNGGSEFPDLSGASNGQNQNVLNGLFNAGIGLFQDNQTTNDAHAAGIQGPGGADGRFNSGSAGWSTDQAHAAGIQGPGGADGQFNSGSAAGATNYAGYVQAGIALFSDAMAAQERDKKSKSNAGTGAAVGGVAGGVIGGIFGGPAGAQIGQQIGSMAGAAIGSMFKWGPQNPEAKARHAFANFVEDGFKKLERVSFFDAQGKMRMFDAQQLDFREGKSTRFNSGGDNGADWGENFDKLGEQTKGFFEGLGQAFEEVLGITEDVGAQLGYILAENLSGNINNARLLVAQLEVDLEDMQQALIKAGKTGEMSWAQVEQGMGALNQAYGKGLVEVGNIAGAWEQFIGSGGRGIAALKSLKDLAVETMEAGGKTLADLEQRLLQSGASPEEVAALMKAISQRGITSLEALEGANERTLGGIVADTENGSQKLREYWKTMSEGADGLKKTIDGIDDNMEKNLVIKVKTEFDSNTEQALGKGVFSETGASKLSNVKMASLSPSTGQYRRTVPSSNTAKMQAVSINVDARGAERGVHADVLTAMSVMENRIMTKTNDMIYQQVQRGAL